MWVSLKVLHLSCDQLKPPGAPVTLEDTKLHHLQGRGVDVDSAESGRPVLIFSDNHFFFSLFLSLLLHQEFFFLLFLASYILLQLLNCLFASTGNRLMNLSDVLTASKPFWIETFSRSCRNLSDNPEIICFH